MSTELDKVREEMVKILIPYGPHRVGGFEHGFRTAHRLEVLVLHPEVRSLIEALKLVRAYSLGKREDICDGVLAPWQDALKEKGGV